MALLGVDMVAPLLLIISGLLHQHDLQHAEDIWIAIRVGKSDCVVRQVKIKILWLVSQDFILSEAGDIVETLCQLEKRT